MILLEFQNRIIAEALSGRLETQEEDGPDPIDVTIADFGGAMYHMSNPEGDRSKIQVSIKLTFFHQLEEFGVQTVLAREYGDMLIAPESGYDATVLVDLANLTGTPAEVTRKVSLFRRHCFAGLFETFFQYYRENKKEITRIDYRPDEQMYVLSEKGRVAVIFNTKFHDADDTVIGKVFLQEMKEARKGDSPQVHYYTQFSPPAEIAEFPEVKSKQKQAELARDQGQPVDDEFYITFTLFPRHLEEKHAEKTIDLVHLFRDYLHYHLKCSKVYMHSKMRSRTVSLLQVLNRARPEKKKERKTAQGKRFEQQK